MKKIKKTCRNCKFNMDGKCDEMYWVINNLWEGTVAPVSGPLTVKVNPDDSLICFNKGRNL